MSIEKRNRDIAEVMSGARIVNFLPYIAEEIDKMKAAVYNRVHGAVRDGKMSPELAQSLWLEWVAYDNLVRKIETKTKVLGSKASRVAGDLEI